MVVRATHRYMDEAHDLLACLRHPYGFVAPGNAITIRAMLDKLISMAKVEVKVETDPARLRPSDVEVLIGDASKFRADTGWEPKIPFDQTLSDLLDYWRDRIARRRPAGA